jgi:hypothetical protein
MSRQRIEPNVEVFDPGLRLLPKEALRAPASLGVDHGSHKLTCEIGYSISPSGLFE